MTAQEAYDELSFYTLTKTDSFFIHQNIVDAFAAQTADEKTKPIKLTFALVGLYLTVEKGYTGRQVQQVHMELGKQKKQWPSFSIPENRGKISVYDVLKAVPGSERDEMIKKWCASVWEAYRNCHEEVKKLVND